MNGLKGEKQKEAGVLQHNSFHNRANVCSRRQGKLISHPDGSKPDTRCTSLLFDARPFANNLHSGFPIVS